MVGASVWRRAAWLIGCALALVFGIAASGPASASADANAVVPNSAFTNFTSTTMGPSDDGSWPCGPTDQWFLVVAPCPVTVGGTQYNGPAPFPLGFNINFYGSRYSGAYVNTNGNITFGA